MPIAAAGFFAHGLASLFPKVIGIETNEEAVAHARRAAGSSETYRAGETEILLGEILEAHPRPQNITVLLDPPAAGLKPRVLEQLTAFRPAEVIYVSCDPGTLARDLKTLCRTHRLVSVTPLDMFPQTAEIEAVAHLLAAT
jgi:23S rRNA (uracil1939-C5)-methyltransferase